MERTFLLRDGEGLKEKSLMVEGKGKEAICVMNKQGPFCGACWRRGIAFLIANPDQPPSPS
jgi:hypothetical protein